MSVDHETALAAFFAHLVANTEGFETTGRRVIHWTQVQAQPAMFFRQVGTTDEIDHANFYPVTTLETEIWLYSNTGKDIDAVPAIDLNALVTQIRDSFVPDGDYGDPRFTIGGLVHWCRIEGKSDYSPGDQGGQAIARIPVRITLP